MAAAHLPRPETVPGIDVFGVRGGVTSGQCRVLSG
jgi:hypothetical protein